MEKEFNLSERLKKVRYKYGGKIHYLLGSTSLCGVWKNFGVVSNDSEVTCKKCKLAGDKLTK